MTTPRKTPYAAAVDRLMDAELKDVVTASRDELKAMIRDLGDDPDEVVPAMRKAVLQRLAERDAARPAPVIATSATGSRLNRISRILDSMSDWKVLAARIFEVGDGSIGNARQAFAKSASKRVGSPAPKSSNFRKWRQGDLLLTLSRDDQAPYTVTLAVERLTELKVVRLCWIDEDTVAGAPGAPPRVVPFPVEPIGAGTYRVAMKIGDFNRRMLAIAVAQAKAGNGDADPRLLLPFVEME